MHFREKRNSLALTHRWFDGCCSIWARRAQSGCESPRTGLPKITLGRIQCTATIIFRLQKKKKKKRARRHHAAAGKQPLILVSGCVFWPHTHFPFVCHDDLQLTTSTFAARSLDVPRTAMLAIVGFCLDVQAALQPESWQSIKKLLGYEALDVMCIPIYPSKCNIQVPGWMHIHHLCIFASINEFLATSLDRRTLSKQKKSSRPTSGNMMMQ